MKVLIVEDNEDSRMILKRTLESIGYTVKEASNGVEALKLARESPPDMVISDILMPEMDGFRLCCEVKHDEDLKKIPFVFYTATYKDLRDEKLAIALGASRFILKPIEPDEFLKIIKEVLQEYKEKKLPVPEGQLEDDISIYRMYVNSLVRKLDKKIKDLEHSEERYRTIVENTFDIIHTLTPEGIITFITPNVSLWGYSPEEIIGHNFMEFVHPDDVEHVAQNFQRTITTGAEFLTSAQLRTKDGGYIYFEEYGKALRKGDKIIQITGSIRDITQRKKMEDEIKKRIKKLEEFYEMSVGRELKMVELKKRIKDLEKKLSEYKKIKEDEGN